MKLFAKDGDKFVEVESRALKDEGELQRLFEQHTNLIPTDMDSRRRAIREFPTDAGPIDHVVVDATGEVLVLETKLARNTDRRTVIAQAIDYAAQLTKFGPHSFLERAQERAGEDFARGWFQASGARDDFLRNLETNLRQGRLTMLIVMDEADDRLKDAVRFLNRATHFSCLLAEVRVTIAAGQELVSVDVYGEEMVEEKSGAEGRSRTMTPDLFVQRLAERGLEAEATAFLAALEWAEDLGGKPWASPPGYGLWQVPGIGYNYLQWQLDRDKIDVWASADVYERMREYLETITSPWAERIETRSLDEDKKYGKMAYIEVNGATEAEFKQLFDFYLSGPQPQGGGP